MYVDAAAVADVQEAKPHVVEVGKRQIVLVRWNGEVIALRNICPHHSQSFAKGIVRGQYRSSGVGKFELAASDSAALICPHHRWQFDVSEGFCLTDPTYRIRRYKTKIEGDRVLVDMGRSAKSAKSAKSD